MIRLDEDFCETLEHKITEALENISGEKVIGFWCEGVLLSEPDNYYSQKFINDNRQTKMKTYIGKDGQGVYSLTLKFGSKALSRYARNLDIAECIPQTDFEKWFSIDTAKQEIEIQLIDKESQQARVLCKRGTTLLNQLIASIGFSSSLSNNIQ